MESFGSFLDSWVGNSESWGEKHRYKNNCYKDVSRRARVKDEMQDWLHGPVTEGPMLSLIALLPLF